MRIDVIEYHTVKDSEENITHIVPQEYDVDLNTVMYPLMVFVLAYFFLKTLHNVHYYFKR